MKKLMKREKVTVEYDAPQGFSGDSPKSPHRRSSEHLDFNDVFGGPPRRFSMQEMRVRYSFGDSEEEGASSSMPVFGEESAAWRRRRQGDDFFDDIFRGDESPRSCGNLIGSNPGSRIMSPVRTLPPKADPFGTSLPAQLSLPAKLTKAMELPTFAPRNHSRNKMHESTNGSNSPRFSNSLSRFSNLGIRGHDGITDELYPIHHESPLPHEASFTTDDSSSTVTSDQKENIENFKNDKRNVDGFHFSIYRWAGGGVQMLMPLVGGNNLKSKDISGEIDHIEPESLKMENEKRGLRSKEETKKLQNSFQEALNENPESKSRSSSKDNVVFGGAKQNIKDEQVKSLDEIDLREKIEIEVPLKVEESRKSEMKPLHAFLSDEVEVEVKQPGNITEMNENKTTTSKKVHESKNMKKNGGTVMNLSNVTVDKSSLPGAVINSGMASSKSYRVMGKVRDFVQIFNEEADSRPKADVQRRSQSFRWKEVGVKQEENEMSLNAAKLNLKNVDKNPNVSLKVDENINKDEAQHSRTKNPSRRSFQFSANQKNSFSSESIHKDSKISVENSDDLLEDNFLVQELFDDHEKVAQSEGSEDIKALDTKIQQWSVGRKGNIRSLLSTLQYVLWPGSGWKPVPLVDLIEANSVKRAYQKALLRLHPDKLQQQDAAVHHKYIAEKVFDILQEAWDGFNTLALL